MASTTTDTTPTTSTGTTRPPGITTHIPTQLIGMPLLAGSVHLQSFPIEIRSISRPSNAENTQQTGNSSQSIPVTNDATTSGGINRDVPSAPISESNNIPIPNTNNTPQTNNPNVEFFMEVTPESITIDSLEAALLNSNQTRNGKFIIKISCSG